MEYVSRDGLALALSALPIAWLVVALAVIKLKAWQATLSAAAIAVALSLAFFSASLPAAEIPGVVASGVAFALCPISLLVFAALFTYAVTVESGAMDVIRAGLGGISDDKRVIALLIAWAFGNFMEGMAGFGSAVAIPAAMLVGMGFDPVKSVLMCLVANTTPTAFGSVGVPLTTLASESGSEVMYLAWTTALLQCAIQAACPVLVLLAMDGFKALRGMWRMIIVVDAAFIVPWLLTAKYVGCELPNVIGGICAMLAIGLSCRRGGFAGAGAQLRAWAPFGFVVALLGVNAFLPASVKAHLTPGVLVLVAGFVGGLVQRVPPNRLLAVLWRTAAAYWPAFATICFVLALARVMGASGMTSTIAAALAASEGKGL